MDGVSHLRGKEKVVEVEVTFVSNVEGTGGEERYGRRGGFSVGERKIGLWWWREVSGEPLVCGGDV